MNARTRSFSAVALVLLGFALLVPPGRSQDAPSVRFAFSDTTLLRDTLNLHFDRLFPLADSLRVPPEFLRRLSVRYRMPLERIVYLSDSLRLPVDSVGAVMERERFNPLTTTHERIAVFVYNSTYQLAQGSRSHWDNGGEFTLSSGGVTAHNVTTIGIDRLRGDLFAKSRVAETEVNYRYSRNFSLGGRVFLQRTDGFDVLSHQSTATNEYQVTMRTSARPRPNLSANTNLFAGPFEEPGSAGVPAKRGLNTQFSGSAQYHHSNWLSYDLSARLTTKLGRGRLEERSWLPLTELFGGGRGALSLFEASPVSLRFSHDIQRNHAENPDTTSSPGESVPSYYVRALPSGTSELSLALQLRQGARGSMTATGTVRNSERLLRVGGLSKSSTSSSDGVDVDARYQFWGWNLDGQFSLERPVAEDPLRTTRTRVGPNPAGQVETTLVVIDYRQQTVTFNRSLDVGIDRAITSRLSVRAKAHVFLGSPRSSIVDSSYRQQPDVGTLRVTPTEPRDNYDDGIQLEGIYSPMARFNTSVQLEVSTRDNINLLSSSSSSNNDVRTYRAQWSWTYRLMEGLTATQRNQVSADYTYFPYASQQDLLAMRYDIRTTLNAVVTPRFRIDLTHVNEEQPRGSYLPDEDGVRFFRVTGRTRSYTLSTNLSYTPLSAISLTFTPIYRTETIPNSADMQRSFNFAAGASLNLPVGSRGSLTGGMARTYASRSASPGSPPTPGEYAWNGSLQFSWRLE